EDGAGPVLVQLVVVLRRDDAADDDQDVVAAQVRERLPRRRDQREVAGRERADADDVIVVIDGLAGRLLRRLEQRADIDVETQVGERRGDDLLAAVVAVLAELGDQNAGPTPLPRQ